VLKHKNNVCFARFVPLKRIGSSVLMFVMVILSRISILDRFCSVMRWPMKQSRNDRYIYILVRLYGVDPPSAGTAIAILGAGLYMVEKCLSRADPLDSSVGRQSPFRTRVAASLRPRLGRLCRGNAGERRTTPGATAPSFGGALTFFFICLGHQRRVAHSHRSNPPSALSRAQ
jgi:hypothetical protein